MENKSDRWNEDEFWDNLTDIQVEGNGPRVTKPSFIDLLFSLTR